jgi:FlaA1/EpsC-like NDP-sugar epimerase
MRNRYFLAADLLLILCSAVAAFSLRFDLLFMRTRSEVWAFLAAAVVVKPLVFYGLGVYRRYWPAASTGELLVLAGANALSTLVLGLLVSVGLLFGVFPEFSRSVLLIDFLIFLVLTGGVRFLFRVLADTSRRTRKANGRRATDPRRVLVAGAGEAGVMVARESQRNPQLGLEIVGFLDDDPIKHGKRIAAVDVLGPLSALEHVVGSQSVDEVVIALPTAPGSTVRALVEACLRLNVRSRTVPGVFELLSDRVSVRRLRDVQITDLLRRHPVRRDLSASTYLTGSVVLVTGAGGSVGSELCRQVAAAGPRRLVLVGHGENSIFDISLELRRQFPHLVVDALIADVRDGRRVRQVFEQYAPQVVFHAAAHKHVPLMEANPEEAVTNNVIGTARVLDAAHRAGTERFVLVSTDKAVSPSSIMGATKRLAEHLVHAAARRHGRAYVVVRFGNVLGSRGSVVPMFAKQIERGGPVTITHPDMKRYFMTIPEAAHLILEAAGFGRPGEAYVLNMGDPVRIVDLARDLIRLSGADVRDIAIEFTGMRPGEKLLEELWEDDASVDETPHPDVFRLVEPARPRLDQEAEDVLSLVARPEEVSPAAVEGLVALSRTIVAGTLAGQPAGRAHRAS